MVWDFSCILRSACIAANFPLRTALAVFHVLGSLCFHFRLSQGLFWFLPRSHCLPIRCSSMCLCGFPVSFLWPISSFKPLWSEKLPDMMSAFLSLLSLVMCPVSFNLIVCIGPAREELGNNRKELFSLLALIKKNTVTLLWFNSYISQCGQCEVC